MPVSNTGMDKDEQKGLLYGSLIAAGINAARGRNVGDGLLKAAQGGSQAYMGGLNHLYDRKKQELEAQRQEQLNKLTGMQVQKAQADIDMQPFERDKMLQEIATSKSLEQQRQIDAGKRVRLENENDIVGNLSMQRQTLPTDYLQKVIPEQGGQTVDKLLTGYLSEYEPGRKLLSEQAKAQQAKDELARKETKDDAMSKYQMRMADAADRRASAAEQRSTETGGKSDARMAMSLRKEFNGLQPVKDYHEISTKFNVMDKAFDESKKTKNFVAVDQALITIYNKMTDPQSVVRESEYVRTPEDMAVLSRVKAGVARVAKGGRLEPDTRQALMTMAGKFRDVYNDKYNQIAGQYEGYASQSGLDPSQVIPKRQTTIAPSMPEKTVGGVTYINDGKGWRKK